MNKFNEAYDKIINEIKYRNIFHSISSIPTLEAGVIYEDCAFHKLPRKFTDILIEKIKWMKKTKTIEFQFDVRDALKTIELNEVENFKDFYSFIQILSNSSEKILTLKMGFENSFSEPIELYELSNAEYSKVFHNEPYKDELKRKIKNASFSKALMIMKKNLDEFENVGTLEINPNTITDDAFEYDNDDTIIGHEIRHFIIFLQRWSKTNYEVCRRYSDNVAEYDRDNPDFRLYSLNEDEFITASSTYIERLVNIFMKNKRNNDFNEMKLLIKSLLFKSSGIMKDSLNNDFYWLDILDENAPQINTVIHYFRNIFNDATNDKDKFNTLMKWTLKTFQERLNNECI